MQGIDNVYAQHVPLIKDLIEQLLRGNLKDTLYPSIILKDQIVQNNLHKTNQRNQLHMQGKTIKKYLNYLYVYSRFLLNFCRPSEIIIYVIGGITYEESLHIHMMNKQGARIIFGGSYVHNFSSFIDEVIAGT